MSSFDVDPDTGDLTERSAYDDSTKCPDDGRCSHGCGPGPCYRVDNCSPLTSYGEDWTDEDREWNEALRASEAAGGVIMKRLMQQRREVEIAAAIVAEQEQEIARHHRDFERWEEMASKGAGQIERLKFLERAVEVLGPVAELYLEAFDDDDRMTMVEALRYTEVRDTVAALKFRETL